MITNSFDANSPAKINPPEVENKVKVDGCVISFSLYHEDYIIDNYDFEEIGVMASVSNVAPLFLINHKGKKIAFFKTAIGAPATVGLMEEVAKKIDTKDFLVFGSAGTLDKDIPYGTVMVPNKAYRDEGTSYHYIEPSDYVDLPNHRIVCKYLEKKNIPYVCAPNWTTDAFYRETQNNIDARKADGCVSVDMECSGVQAMCTFRGYNLYYFLVSADMLDAEQWDKRKPGSINEHAAHKIDTLELALDFFVEKE